MSLLELRKSLTRSFLEEKKASTPAPPPPRALPCNALANVDRGPTAAEMRAEMERAVAAREEREKAEARERQDAKTKRRAARLARALEGNGARSHVPLRLAAVSPEVEDDRPPPTSEKLDASPRSNARDTAGQA